MAQPNSCSIYHPFFLFRSSPATLPGWSFVPHPAVDVTVNGSLSKVTGKKQKIIDIQLIKHEKLWFSCHISLTFNCIVAVAKEGTIKQHFRRVTQSSTDYFHESELLKRCSNALQNLSTEGNRKQRQRCSVTCLDLHVHMHTPKQQHGIEVHVYLCVCVCVLFVWPSSLWYAAELVHLCHLEGERGHEERHLLLVILSLTKLAHVFNTLKLCCDAAT